MKEENLNQKITVLEAEIQKIKERNRRVEADKAWETSRTRTAFVASSTYLLILIVMLLINADHPYFNAFLAAVSYIISTESYGILKKWWLQRKHS